MKSRTSTETKSYLYRGFSGLNTSAADIALENEEAQALVETDNLFCSHRGYASNERPLSKLGSEVQRVIHARYFAARPQALAYAARTGAVVSLRALEGQAPSAVEWPVSAAPSSCIFNRKAVFVAAGQKPQVFDDHSWSRIDSADAFGARYCAAIQGRLAMAGFDAAPTEVVVSRVNDELVMPSEEGADPASQASAIKAFRFDIGNLVSTSDRVKGLASVETNKLAVFTNERVIVYAADPDYARWTLESSVSVNIGTISNNTLCASGDELLFCSRDGVHSLRRSSLNGLTMFTLPLSDSISELYELLVASVVDAETISACFDKEAGRYHVFFPISGNTSYRLTLDLFPLLSEGQPSAGKWSFSTFAGQLCGDSLAGNTAIGTISGFQLVGKEYATTGVRGAASAVTPILWHGDFLEPKQSHSLIIYASGAGRVTISAEDETGRQLNTVLFDLPKADQTNYLGVPLQRQFERPFQHRYTGLRLRVKIESDQQVRIFAVGVRLRPT